MTAIARILAESDSVVMLSAARKLGIVALVLIVAAIWWVVRRL